MSGLDDRQELRDGVQSVHASELPEQRQLPEEAHARVRVQLHGRVHGRALRSARLQVVQVHTVRLWQVRARPDRSLRVRVHHARLRGHLLRDRALQSQVQVRRVRQEPHRRILLRLRFDLHRTELQ